MVKRILHDSLKQYVAREIKCVFLLILYTSTTLLFPMFVSCIIDKGISNRDLKATFIYSSGMLLVGLVAVTTQYLQQVSFYKLGQELLVDIKQRIYGTVLRTNSKYWEENSVGDVLTVLEDDTASLEMLLTSTISGCAVNIIVAFGITTFIMITDWKCGIIVTILVLIFAVMQRRFGSTIEDSMEYLRTKIGELISFTNESLQYANELQAAGYEKIARNKYLQYNKSVMDAAVSQTKKVSSAVSVGTLFNVTGLFVVISIGSFRAIHGSMTIGTLFALTVYVQRLYGPVVSLGQAYIDFKNSLPKMHRIINVLDTPHIIRSGEYKFEEIKPLSICFDDVSFSYNDDKALLKNFNYKLESGKIVGLVGENGTGKSTLFKLLLNLCTPDKGHIYINGKKVEEYDNDYLREKIAYVGQQGFMLSDSLRDILDPRGISNDKELETLMEDFLIDKNKLGTGLNTYIDENHKNISGGEFQKLALIRAFVEPKDIYLLDEPTSAIDPESERSICEKIKEKLAGKAALIITHRPEILKICDEVISFGNGITPQYR